MIMMRHVEFTYSGGFETTIAVPNDQPLRAIIESVLRQVKPGRSDYKDTATIRVLINGQLIPEENYNRIPSSTDFVKVQEIQTQRTLPMPVKETGPTDLFKQTLQDLRDLWDTLIRPIGRFLWWPWRSLIAGCSNKPAKKDAPTLSAVLGGTLQVLIPLAVIDKEWLILVGLVIGYYLLSRHIRKVAARK